MDQQLSPIVYTMLMDAIRGIDEDDVEAVSAIIRDASALIRQGQTTKNEGSSPAMPLLLAQWQTRKLERYIEQNLTEPLLVGELAEQVGLSASHFSRLFRNSFGVSPYHYVIRSRVDRAKRALQLSDARLSEIALDCGLADQSHLTRVFKRFTGITPSRWRRISRNRAS